MKFFSLTSSHKQFNLNQILPLMIGGRMLVQASFDSKAFSAQLSLSWQYLPVERVPIESLKCLNRLSITFRQGRAMDNQGGHEQLGKNICRYKTQDQIRIVSIHNESKVNKTNENDISSLLSRILYRLINRLRSKYRHSILYFYFTFLQI